MQFLGWFLGWFLGLAILVAIGFILFSPMFKSYRTVIAGWLAAILGGAVPLITQIVGYLQELDWRQYLLAGDRKNLAVLGVVGGLGVIMVILRYMTSGKVGEK